jgi:hypothetical protein
VVLGVGLAATERIPRPAFNRLAIDEPGTMAGGQAKTTGGPHHSLWHGEPAGEHDVNAALRKLLFEYRLRVEDERFETSNICDRKICLAGSANWRLKS